MAKDWTMEKPWIAAIRMMKHETFNDPVLNLLVEGRANVERGWCKFVRRDGNGNVCALGAMDNGYSREYNKARAILALQAPQIVQRASSLDDWHSSYYTELTIAKYNSDPSTTKEDILALFDLAIAARMQIMQVPTK